MQGVPKTPGTGGMDVGIITDHCRNPNPPPCDICHISTLMVHRRRNCCIFCRLICSYVIVVHIALLVNKPCYRHVYETRYR